MEPILKNEIRIDVVYRIIKSNWKKYIAVGFIAALLSSLIIICVPRYYTVRVLLAPEYGNTAGGLGALGDAASFLGINVGGLSASDAIVPQFYPELIASTDFLTSVMDIQVESNDGEFKGAYSQYIVKDLEYPWWTVLVSKIKMLFKGAPEPLCTDPGYKVNPFSLTKTEFDVIKNISSSLNCSVDSKTDIISIFATAQDPKVAAMLADGVKELLQDFIIRYRTEKTKIDLKYASELCDKAYSDYIAAQSAYADYVDKHQGLSRQAFMIEEQRLEAEMQLAYNMYNSVSQQKLLATAKLQERTPAFTALQNASIPLKPTGPKRMIIVLLCSILSVVAYTFYLVATDNVKNNGKA